MRIAKVRKYEMMFVVLISLRLCVSARGFYSPLKLAGLALFRDMSQIPENAE